LGAFSDRFRFLILPSQKRARFWTVFCPFSGRFLPVGFPLEHHTKYQPSAIIHGGALAVLKRMRSASVQTCITSPPYWGLRDYGVPGQIGLEKTPEEYVAKLVEVFREVRRAARRRDAVAEPGRLLRCQYQGSSGTWRGAKQKP
jgi:hypothetical protein